MFCAHKQAYNTPPVSTTSPYDTRTHGTELTIIEAVTRRKDEEEDTAAWALDILTIRGPLCHLGGRDDDVRRGVRWGRTIPRCADAQMPELSTESRLLACRRYQEGQSLMRACAIPLRTPERCRSLVPVIVLAFQR